MEIYKMQKPNKNYNNKFSKNYEVGLNKIYDFNPDELEKYAMLNSDLKLCQDIIKKFGAYGDCSKEIIELERIKRQIKKLVKLDANSFNLIQASTKYMYHNLKEKYDQK